MFHVGGSSGTYIFQIVGKNKSATKVYHVFVFKEIQWI